MVASAPEDGMRDRQPYDSRGTRLYSWRRTHFEEPAHDVAVRGYGGLAAR